MSQLMFSQEETKAAELELDEHTHQRLSPPAGVPDVPQTLGLTHQPGLPMQTLPQQTLPQSTGDPFAPEPSPTAPQQVQQQLQYEAVQVSQLPQSQPQSVVQSVVQHVLQPNPSDIGQHAELGTVDQPQHPQDDQGPLSKKQRRRYDNNFKAEVLDHLKIPGTKLPAVAKQYGIPENTLREWTKVSVVQSIEAARAKHGGTLKANMYDPMHRLTESLMVFFDRNERQPQHLKQPVTTKLVVAKGLEARSNLLELNEIQSFLDPKEKKALESFTGSDSWAKKFAKRHDLKMTGARVKELGDDDVRSYSVQLRQMSSRVKQAGPGYEEVASLLRQAAEKLVAARIVAARRMGQPQPQLT